MEKILIVGAGLSGAIIGRTLADAGFHVDIIEARSHIAGNCHTAVDPDTGIMVHTYGPHIFHTDNASVWDYIQQFGKFMPYICRVKAKVKENIFSLPINLSTINQFFSASFNPKQAKAFIATKADSSITEAVSFEDQVLKTLGKELYKAFFLSYPLKQWGVHPKELPASIIQRLPVRFNYEDNYFAHRFQGIPVDGYTHIIGNILDHSNIRVTLNRSFSTIDRNHYHHVFYSGPLDGWFNYQLGYLGYRTLKFEASRHEGDFQGCAVMSYPDLEVPFTRITEHKYFTPWQSFDDTIIFKEYSSLCQPGEIPYYPIRLVKEKSLLKEYIQLANQQKNVTFVGRLGTYRYLDMDVTVLESLNAANDFIKLKKNKLPIPTFFVSPI